MRCGSAGWIFLPCALLATVLPVAQTPAHNPSDSAEQFDGTFHASRDAGVKEAYLERIFHSSHAANLVKLNNGDLLCFWFSGTAEGESNVAILESRLAKGSERWSKPVEIDHQDGRSFQNPVAFQVPSGRLLLLHTSQPAGQGQSNAEVLYLTSDDAGKSWTTPRPLFQNPGSFIRQPPIVLSESAWMLPMYYTPGRSITDGAELDYSAVEITDDADKHWKECRIPQSNGLVQQSIVRLKRKNGYFLGLFRSRYADFIYQSTSRNGCDWTVPAPTHLPNNNSSIQSAMLRDGALVVAFNNSSAGITRDEPRTSARKPLSIALSEDGGATWPWVRDIEAGGVQGDKDASEEYSYPSLLQDAEEKIIVAYTFRRETIKIVRFDEEWIKQGGTAGKFKGDRRK